MLSATVVIAILAFFGYEKVDKIEKTILERANQRLEKTDSLLAKIDEKRIDEINQRLIEKEKEYQKTISHFDKLISQSKEIEKRLLDLLPENERTEYPLEAYIVKPPSDLFEIRSFPSKFKVNEKANIFMILSENIDLKKVKVLSIKLMHGDTLIKDYYYKPKVNLNKMSITFDVKQGDYRLLVGFFAESKKEEDIFYKLSQKITLK